MTQQRKPLTVMEWTRHLITSAERDLKRKLSDGERRDLLKDNTRWRDSVVNAAVETYKNAEQRHGKE